MMPDGIEDRNSMRAIDYCKPLLGGCWDEFQRKHGEADLLRFEVDVRRREIGRANVVGAIVKRGCRELAG